MNELETLDNVTKAPPSSRIGTSENAYQFLTRLSDADQSRAIIRTRIKGNIDGNAPFKASVLKSRGLDYVTNLNFRQGQAVVNQFKVPYYDLAVEVPRMADIRTSFGDSPDQREEWSEIMSDEYDRMVRKWEDWDYVLQFSQYQMLVFGVGMAYFRDPWDWRPDVCKAGDILVEDGAKSRVSELNAIILLKNWGPPELYSKIRNEKIARDLGWKIAEVEKAIINARFSNQEPTLQASMYEWYQQKFKNADIFYGTYDCEAVQTGNMLIREFPEMDAEEGKVSHHMVRSDQSTNDFLYSKIGRFQAMEDVIVPFFFDIGDGTWHSINGVGKEIYAYCHVFNMLRCREVDGAMIASSILLKNKDSSSVTKSQLVEVLNLGILPSNLEFQPNAMGQNIEAVTGVRRDMEATLGSNIGILQNSPTTPNPRKGQKQAILEMQQRAQLGKGNINRWYTTYDKLHEKMATRSFSSSLKAGMGGSRLALEMRQRCVDRGVPKECFDLIDEVKACRSLGAGSAVNALMVTEAIIDNINLIPSDEGKTEATRLWLSRLTNQSTVNLIMGEKKRPENTDDAWEAVMENNALRNGGKVIITKTQSNVTHLQIHLGDAEDHIKEVEEQAQGQQMDMGALQGLVVHLDAAGIHCAEHLKAIREDAGREKDYKELQKRWQMMSRIADKAKQQLAEMQQQAAQEQQQPFDPKVVPYKDAPESVKAQIETAAGLNRGQGEMSVPGEKQVISAQKAATQNAKSKQGMALNDVKTSLDVEKHNRDMQQPPSQGTA